MQKHQDAGAGSHSTDANNLGRGVLAGAVRGAIGQFHDPREASVGGSGRAGPEMGTTDLR